MNQATISKFCCILFLSFSLEGCLPVIFTGAAGSALELAKDRTAGDTVNDVKISTSIKAAFIKKNFRELYTKIKVEVVAGRVLLTGRIDKEEDAMTAVSIAWEQKEVKEVINELKVDKLSNNFNLAQYTKDAFITSQIKSKTFMNRDIKFVNYTVITLDDIVYLFGIARSEAELEQVANMASNIRGVKKVISHVKIHDVQNKSTFPSYQHKPKQTKELVIDNDTDHDHDLNDILIDDQW